MVAKIIDFTGTQIASTGADERADTVREGKIRNDPQAIADERKILDLLDGHQWPSTGHRSVCRSLEGIEPIGPYAGIDRRAENLDDLLRWLREAAWKHVANWPEVFALAIRNSEVRLDRVSERHPEKADEIPPIVLEMVRDYKEDVVFWTKIEAIFQEEMQEAEKVAEQARQRAAKRIRKMDEEVAKYIAVNDPQGYANLFDWS